MASYWYRLAGLVFLGAAGALGCDSGETTEGPTCPDDPAEGAVSEECGIWVSAGKGNDANEGTQVAPVATLMHAIELAEKGTRRVYACGETWTEVLMVPSGVSIHGGFDCEAGWAYTGEPARGQLASPGPTAITWFAGDSHEMTYFTDFYVEAADATEPSGSSIAGFVSENLDLTVRRSEFVAGNGADGLDGDPGDPDGLSAPDGPAGNDGADACSAPVSNGGPSPEAACADGVSRGGNGGDSSPVLAENGGQGEPDSNFQGGEGGLGQSTAPACTDGSPGLDGFDGKHGWGGNEYGRLTAEGYVGNPGTDAEPGSLGQGGGGGGAVFGSVAVCGPANPGGAAGGSGGAGGCGGKGGKGGQPGGSSFAFATRSDFVEFDQVVLRAGNGGNGGNGGAGQLGGWGGAGGNGGKDVGSISSGCAGGKGGRGGKGGIGGGGAGGHSVALVYINGVDNPGIEYHLGTPGLGGASDPSPNATGAKGHGGLYTVQMPFDP